MKLTISPKFESKLAQKFKSFPSLG